jgi:hypothetical protein
MKYWWLVLLILPCFSCAKNTVAGPPAKILINGPISFAAGSCAGPFSVIIEDSSGNPTTSATNESILLNSTISNTIKYYTDVNCEDQASSLTIPAGFIAGNLYFMETKAGNFSVSLNSSLAFIQANGLVTPGTTQKIAITTPLTAVFQNECAGPFNITTTDPYGNITSIPVVVNFDNGVVNSYVDGACGEQSNQLTTNVDPNNPTFFYMDSPSGDLVPVTITVESLYVPSTIGTLSVPIENSGI